MGYRINRKQYPHKDLELIMILANANAIYQLGYLPIMQFRDMVSIEHAVAIWQIELNARAYIEELHMIANSSLTELVSIWQPFEDCFESLRAELRNMEKLSTSLSTELESLQQELLRRAHLVETLQAELSIQRSENLRLVARCENQEQHIHEEFISMRSMMQSLVQRSELESDHRCPELVKFSGYEGFAS